MPQMKNYTTRQPVDLTGDEYVVVTDISESKTYKVNLVGVLPNGLTGTYVIGGTTVTLVDGIITEISP